MGQEATDAPSELGKISSEIARLSKELKKLQVEEGTIRVRYIDCGRCPILHGPYVYVYRRREGELQESYLGKDFERAEKIRRAMEIAKEIRRLKAKRRKLQ